MRLRFFSCSRFSGKSITRDSSSICRKLVLHFLRGFIIFSYATKRIPRSRVPIMIVIICPPLGPTVSSSYDIYNIVPWNMHEWKYLIVQYINYLLSTEESCRLLIYICLFCVRQNVFYTEIYDRYNSNCENRWAVILKSTDNITAQANIEILLYKLSVIV